MGAEVGVGIYVKNSQAAVETYCAAFGWTLGYHVRNEDGSFFHSELKAGGQTAIAVVEAPEAVDGTGNPVELDHTFQTREDLVKAFELLKEGGKVTLGLCELPWSPCAACVTDRFGVRWYLTLPGHHPPEDFKPGDEK